MAPLGISNVTQPPHHSNVSSQRVVPWIYRDSMHASEWVGKREDGAATLIPNQSAGSPDGAPLTKVVTILRLIRKNGAIALGTLLGRADVR
jgi:hypothetical protein